MLRVEMLEVGSLPPLSFDVTGGECLAVEGPSGSGKTRLLRAIADLDDAPGFVFLDGIERREMTAPEWRRKVRYQSAEPGWWAATGRAHFPPGCDPARIERLMQSLGLPSDLLDRPIYTLSTGERLRLAFVRGLIDEPRVLLLDEPSSALDTQSEALVDELIRFQLLAGRAVLLVSHDPVEVERLSDRRLQLAAVGQPSHIDQSLPAVER